MANVHGFGDRPNNNNNNRGNAGPNRGAPNFNQLSDQLPFLNTLRSRRAPMEQTIPYTLKIICCPDLKPLSATTIFFVAMWIIYIVCLTQGLNTDNGHVLEVQYNTLLNFGAANAQKVRDGQVWRLIAASFLHLDLLQVSMNSISVLFFVTRMEKLYRWQTIVIMLVSSISGYLLSVTCSNDTTVIVGASAALQGILGAFVAFLIINWKALERYGPIRGVLACIIGVFVFVSLLFSIDTTIDAIGHLGGLVSGLFISLAILPGMDQKSKIITIVGLAGIAVINLVLFLVFYLG